MYAGHAAIALVLKVRRPEVPMLPLVAACYGPDWVDVALMIPHPREGMAPWSHSIPAVLIGAAVASALYGMLAHRPGAGWIFLAWTLHWPADLFTGLKPVLGLDTLVGLDLYHLPYADFALELIAIVVCGAIYARAFAPALRQRWVVAAMCLSLIAAQAVVDAGMAALDPRTWAPSLAVREWRAHVIPEGADTSLRRSAWLLHS